MVDGHERGNHPRHVAERSAFTTAARHPVATGAALAAAAAVGVAMIRSRA